MNEAELLGYDSLASNTGCRKLSFPFFFFFSVVSG